MIGGDERDADRIATQARAAFDRAVETVPTGTANRLRLARRAALSGATPAPVAPYRLRWVVPLGATAALLLGVAWWRQAPMPAPPRAATVAAAPTPPPTAIAALPSEDDADLYAWLAEAPVASDDPADGAL